MLIVSGYLVTLTSGEVFTATVTAFSHEQFGFCRASITKGAETVATFDLKFSETQISLIDQDIVDTASKLVATQYAERFGSIAIRFQLGVNQK